MDIFARVELPVLTSPLVLQIQLQQAEPLAAVPALLVSIAQLAPPQLKLALSDSTATL